MKMDGIRGVLSLLFLISYMLAIRIFVFPVNESKPWYSLLYILFSWLIYCFLLWCSMLYYLLKQSILTQLFYWLNILIALLSVFLGMYYDKKYRTCLKKLDIVDATLEKIGMITDYQKLYTKILFIIFGWIAYIICTAVTSALWSKNCCSAYTLFIDFMFDYPTHVNLLDDLFVINTFGYVQLKFEQINEYLRKMDEDKRHKLKRAWKHSTLLPYQIGHLKFTYSESATWIVIHLHLELCKISRELNSVFGLQMTIKMGIYFIFLAVIFRKLFKMLFITNYGQQETQIIIVFIILLVSYIFQLFIINYICEKVSVKANATGDVITKMPYSNFDIVSRENISQFLLQLNLRPLKFYGLGFFKFGLKFFFKFSSSVTTVIVILVESYTKS